MVFASLEPSGTGPMSPNPEGMGAVSLNPSGVSSASFDGACTTLNHYGSKRVGLGQTSNTKRGAAMP